MRSSTNQKVQIRLTLSGEKKRKEKKRIPGLRSAYGSQCRQKRAEGAAVGGHDKCRG